MVALLQILSRLFNVVQFVKCWQYFLGLSSKRLSCSGKEKESRCLEFTSSTKCEVRHFHVVVVHWRQRNVQKSVMHVQGCCFSSLTYFFFCRSRWRLLPRPQLLAITFWGEYLSWLLRIAGTKGSSPSRASCLSPALAYSPRSLGKACGRGRASPSSSLKLPINRVD